MRLVYKNPKELATFIKDLIDNYLENLISYEELNEKIKKVIEANRERVYKDNKISLKIYPYLGNERVEILNKILEE